jgi:hypothetical protein
MTISAEQVRKLVGSLGTTESLGRVRSEITSLNASLADPRNRVSRVELHDLAGALNSLARGIFEMESALNGLLAKMRVRTVDYVC